MTSTAALPGAGAALRVVRGTAGRCLVRVALLVGGLFVLGVLCGARASATEGAPTPPPLPAAVTAAVTEVTGTAGYARPPTDEPAVARHMVQRHTVRPVTERVVRPVTDRIARPVAEDVVQSVADPVSRPVTDGAVQPGAGLVVRPGVEDVVRPVTDPVSLSRPVAEDLVQPVADSVSRPVVEHVVVPMGDLVESVTEGLAEVQSQLPPVTGVPSLPEMPGLPELPELPVWTTLPVESLPVFVTPQEPGRAGAERPRSAVDGDSGSGGERVSVPASGAYGPEAAFGGAVAVSALHRDAGAGDASVVRVTAQHSPDGLPTSALGRHSTVDNGGPRHAEPQAAASFDRAPLSLVPGAPESDAANGTRDRHQDIPEFPG
ncbi:hypothetical protein OG920_28155 [Streptomyces europaeiscabiei]|uniref:hypothetical protein n=1 Tax=Streptomyces TaxID=1883 RepID=UPI000A3AB508|nr:MULTISPECIES: hypothetical protein [Streptomyces]MDX3635451.1 hypothetical protein [Streptomyces europaeiscabiei]MDX3653682.1 hypothetical protein [Streptomyces europaeiscabiei]